MKVFSKISSTRKNSESVINIMPSCVPFLTRSRSCWLTRDRPRPRPAIAVNPPNESEEQKYSNLTDCYRAKCTQSELPRLNLHTALNVHKSATSFLTICEARSVQTGSGHQGVFGVGGSTMQQVVLQVTPQHKQTRLDNV